MEKRLNTGMTWCRWISAWIGCAVVTMGYAAMGDDDGGFAATTLSGALTALRAGPLQSTTALMIKSPAVIENGASVPVQISSRIPDTQSICLLAKDNPFPIVGCFRFYSTAVPSIGLRIRVNRSTSLIAIALADGKFYQASRDIKVDVGGCGPTRRSASRQTAGATRINVIKEADKMAVHLKIQHLTSRPADPATFRFADFVREVRVLYDKRPVVRALLGPSMADYPYLLAYYRGAGRPSAVSVFWRDNQGRTRTDPYRASSSAP